MLASPSHGHGDHMLGRRLWLHQGVATGQNKKRLLQAVGTAPSPCLCGASVAAQDERRCHRWAAHQSAVASTQEIAHLGEPEGIGGESQHVSACYAAAAAALPCPPSQSCYRAALPPPPPGCHHAAASESARAPPRCYAARFHRGDGAPTSMPRTIAAPPPPPPPLPPPPPPTLRGGKGGPPLPAAARMFAACCCCSIAISLYVRFWRTAGVIVSRARVHIVPAASSAIVLPGGRVQLPAGPAGHTSSERVTPPPPARASAPPLPYSPVLRKARVPWCAPTSAPADAGPATSPQSELELSNPPPTSH
eukprot:289684-Chlamydomonas_euryale.AAC.3